MANQLWGVLIGGLLGLGGSTLQPWLAARRDQARARAFVRAYLVGILEITEARRHVELANALLAVWRSGNTTAAFHHFGSQRESPGDPVENGEMFKQASLLAPDDAADLARFVHSLRAVRIDLDASDTDNFKDAPIDQKITRVEWTINEWLRAKLIAERLIARL